MKSAEEIHLVLEEVESRYGDFIPGRILAGFSASQQEECGW